MSMYDFTSYWIINIDDTSVYIGNLFGKIVLLRNNDIIDLNINENYKIKNVRVVDNTENYKIYILFANGNVYKINSKNACVLKYKDIKNIHSHDCTLYIFDNDNVVYNSNMIKYDKLHTKNTIVAKSSTDWSINFSVDIVICIDNEKISGLCHGKVITIYSENNDIFNIKHIDDIIMIHFDAVILHNKNISIMVANRNIPLMPYHCINLNQYIKTLPITNAVYISPISNEYGLILCDDLSVIKIYANNEYETLKGKFINIPNSHCLAFNEFTCKYYPKYFTNRFITFIKSVKYGLNIKIPKYLLFIIANHLT